MAVFRAASRHLFSLLETKTAPALTCVHKAQKSVWQEAESSRFSHPAVFCKVSQQTCRFSSAAPPPKAPGMARSRKDDSSSSSDSDSSSSDSGDERQANILPLGKRGDTEFWRRKMRTHHNVFDINKDGTVSWDDFEVMHKRFIGLGTFTDKQQQDFKNSLREVWEDYWGGSMDPYTFVMADQFINSMRHVINDKDISRKAHLPLQYFFKAVDHDSSGEISVEEFKTFFKCLGLTEENGVMTFQSIDSNGDGRLSIEEFVALGKEFFLSDDSTLPSKHFWGPLVD